MQLTFGILYVTTGKNPWKLNVVHLTKTKVFPFASVVS